MDLGYVLIKCADKSFKGIDQLKQLKELPDKFNLEEYIKEYNIGNASDAPECDQKQDVKELLEEPEDPVKEKISRYNRLKEKVLHQIIPFCICIDYYDQESNNDLSRRYFDHFIESTDRALSVPLQALEKVFDEDPCDYDTLFATALAIRYGISKGILKVED